MMYEYENLWFGGDCLGLIALRGLVRILDRDF